jgi:hypothetical protein
MLLDSNTVIYAAIPEQQKLRQINFKMGNHKGLPLQARRGNPCGCP